MSHLLLEETQRGSVTVLPTISRAHTINAVDITSFSVHHHHHQQYESAPTASVGPTSNSTSREPTPRKDIRTPTPITQTPIHTPTRAVRSPPQQAQSPATNSSYRQEKDLAVDNWTTLNKAVSLGIHSFQVRHLAIECVELRDSPWRWLLAVIPQLPRLEHLSLKDTAMTDARLSELAGLVCYTVSRGVPAPSAIRQAELFKETIASAITPSLVSLANLRTLNLSDNYLTHKSALAVGKLCMWNIMNLQALDLSGNELGDHGAQVLAVYLSKMSPLRPTETPITSRTRSALSHNGALSSSRPRSEVLKFEAQQRSELENTLNNIIKMVRPDAVDAAVEGLMSLCPSLRARAATAGSVNQRTLHHSAIIPGGRQERHHRFGLVSLDVSDNKLGTRGIAEILAGASKSQIRLLVLSQNAGNGALYIDPNTLNNPRIALTNGFTTLQLSSHCRWRVLDLSSCGLGTIVDRPTTRRALLNILFTCQFLEVLDLSDNNGLGDVLARLVYDMGWEACEKGRAAPRSLANIQSLNINNTDLSDIGATTIMHALLDFEAPIEIFTNLQSIDFGGNDRTLSPDSFANLITFFTDQESPVAVVPLHKMCTNALALSVVGNNRQSPPSPPRAPSFRVEETPKGSPSRKGSQSPNSAAPHGAYHPTTAAPTPYSVADISMVKGDEYSNDSPVRLDIVEANEQESSASFAANYIQKRYEDSPTRMTVTRNIQQATSPALVITGTPPRSPEKSPQAVWRQPSRSPSQTHDMATSPITIQGAPGNWSRNVSPSRYAIASPLAKSNTVNPSSHTVLSDTASPVTNGPTPTSPSKIPSPLASLTVPQISGAEMSNRGSPVKPNGITVTQDTTVPTPFAQPSSEEAREDQSVADTDDIQKKKKKKVVKKVKRKGSTSQVPSEVGDNSRSTSPAPEATTPVTTADHDAILPSASSIAPSTPSHSRSEGQLSKIEDVEEVAKVATPQRHWADGLGLQIDTQQNSIPVPEAPKSITEEPKATSAPVSTKASPLKSTSASPMRPSESPKAKGQEAPKASDLYLPLYNPHKKDPTVVSGKVKDFTLTYSHPPGHIMCQAWHSLHMHLHCEQLWSARVGPEADPTEREETISLLTKLLPVAAQEQPSVYGPIHAQGISTATLKLFFRTAITERALSLRRAMVADVALMMQPSDDDKCVDKVLLDETDEMMGMCTFTIKTNERRMQIAQRLQDRANAGHQEPSASTEVAEGPSSSGNANTYATNEPTDAWKHLRHYMQHCIVSPSEESDEAPQPAQLYSPPFTQDEVDWYGRLAATLQRANAANALQLSTPSGCHLMHDHHGREDQLIAELPEDMVADCRRLKYRVDSGGGGDTLKGVSRGDSFGNISAASDEIQKNGSEVAALDNGIDDVSAVAADASVEPEGGDGQKAITGSPLRNTEAVPSEPMSKKNSQNNSPHLTTPSAGPGWQNALQVGAVDTAGLKDDLAALEAANNKNDSAGSAAIDLFSEPLGNGDEPQAEDTVEEESPKSPTKVGGEENQTGKKSKDKDRKRRKSKDKSPSTPLSPDAAEAAAHSTPRRNTSVPRYVDEEEERAASLPNDQLVPIQQLIAERHKRQLSGSKGEFIQSPFAATPPRESEQDRATTFLEQQKETRVQLLLALCYNSMNAERIELDPNARNKVSACKGKLRGEDDVSVSVEWDQLLVIKRYRGLSEKQIIFVHPLVCGTKATQSDPKSKELLLTCEQPFGPSELGDKIKGEYKGTPNHKKKMIEPDTTPGHSRLVNRSTESSRSVSPSQQQFTNRRVVTLPIVLKRSKDVRKAIEVIQAQEVISHAHFEKMIQKRMEEFHKAEKEREKAAEKEKLRKAAIASSAAQRPPTPPPRTPVV